jgi:hypothetical protein
MFSTKNFITEKATDIPKKCKRNYNLKISNIINTCVKDYVFYVQAADGSSTLGAIEAEYNELISWLLKKTQYLEHLQQTNSLSMVYSVSRYCSDIVLSLKVCSLYNALLVKSLYFEQASGVNYSEIPIQCSQIY